MAIAYQLKITAVTPRGEFTGTFGGQDADRGVIERCIDALRENVSSLRYLALDTEDGYEVVLNQQMIGQSVFKFKVATKFVD